MKRQVKIQLDIGLEMGRHAHGSRRKIGVILHETVSPNFPGLGDVKEVADYLAHGHVGYGIHGITDADGNKAWARGHARDTYWHCAGGPTNDTYQGIEQVSNVVLRYGSRWQRARAWLGMSREINATAQLIAATARFNRWKITDNEGDTSKPGVSTHWEVTKHYRVPGGHIDCWPTRKGGYYPKHIVLARAKLYYKLGYHF